MLMGRRVAWFFSRASSGVSSRHEAKSGRKEGSGRRDEGSAS